jgi:hypothetical protein
MYDYDPNEVIVLRNLGPGDIVGFVENILGTVNNADQAAVSVQNAADETRRLVENANAKLERLTTVLTWAGALGVGLLGVYLITQMSGDQRGDG